MLENRESAPTPLVILTGFLGSGKTTLLNRLLCDSLLGRDTAVVVNEFGQIGIDHLLIMPVADNVVLLESGCVCCSAGRGSRRGAGVAAGAPQTRRTTTVPQNRARDDRHRRPRGAAAANPSDTTLAPDLKIHGVLTVVDAAFGHMTLDRHPECTLQVAVANRLILSKLDLVESTAVDALVARLQSINPSAPILALGVQDLDSAFLFADTADAGVSFGAAAPMAHASRSAAITPARHSDRYATFCLCWDDPLAWVDVEAWLETLLIARGESILRMKGLLHITGKLYPLVVQSVQHALYPPTELLAWPRGVPRSELVFVTRDFSSGAALRSLQQFFPQGPAFTAGPR